VQVYQRPSIANGKDYSRRLANTLSNSTRGAATIVLGIRAFVIFTSCTRLPALDSLPDTTKCYQLILVDSGSRQWRSKRRNHPAARLIYGLHHAGSFCILYAEEATFDQLRYLSKPFVARGARSKGAASRPRDLDITCAVFRVVGANAA